jgi:hypothetical protein
VGGGVSAVLARWRVTVPLAWVGFRRRRIARRILADGVSGSGRLASQRRKRNARSLVVADPNNAVAMIVVATVASQMTMTRPTSGCE